MIPIRGNNCTHLQCFDLESYLFLNRERSLWRCPVCFASVLVEFIEVDEFMLNVLRNAGPYLTQKIEIYPDGKWKPDTGPVVSGDGANPTSLMAGFSVGSGGAASTGPQTAAASQVDAAKAGQVSMMSPNAHPGAFLPMASQTYAIPQQMKLPQQQSQPNFGAQSNVTGPSETIPGDNKQNTTTTNKSQVWINYTFF